MGFFSSLVSGISKFTSTEEEKLDVFEKAEIYTNIHNLHKVAQDLLEKGYNDRGIYVSTKMKLLEKDSEDAENVPRTKWLVGMNSKIRNVGYPFASWDMATHIDYFLKKNAIKVDINIDNRPKVSGDISLYLHSTKLKARFGAPNLLESMMLELLHCREHMALRVSVVDFQEIVPNRLDVSAGIYASCLKLGGEFSYSVEPRQFLRSWVGGAIEANDFSASIIYWRDLNSLIGSFVHHVGEEFDWGIEMSKSISSDPYTATVGVAWKHDADSVSKVKVNHLGLLSCCIERKLGIAVVSVSGQMDCMHPLECPKVGFKMLFKPSAVTYEQVREDKEKH